MDRKQPQEYLVPSMEVKAISGYLSDMGFHISPADIEKPAPQYIQKLYEGIVEVFTEEKIEEVARRASFCEESLSIVVVYKKMKAFLERIGVHDFHLRDVICPERSRTVSILSCVANFSFFKDDKRPVCGSIAQRKFRIDSALSEIDARIKKAEGEREAKTRSARESAQAAERLEGEIAAKEAELLKLHRAQHAATAEVEAVKKEHELCAETVAGERYRALAMKQEVARLRSRIVKNPEELREVLRQMKREAHFEESLNSEYEKRRRIVEESLVLFKEETEKLKKLICEVSLCSEKRAHCRKIEQSLSAYLLENEAAASEIERAESKRGMVDKKVAYITGKMDTLSAEDARMMGEMRERFEELKAQHGRIAREKEAAAAELAKNNAVIREMECEIARTRSGYEEEVAGLHNKIVALRERFISYRSELFSALGVGQ